MSKKADEIEEDDIPEMELNGGVRGKYYERYMQGTNVVHREPDLAQPSDPSNPSPPPGNRETG